MRAFALLAVLSCAACRSTESDALADSDRDRDPDRNRDRDGPGVRIGRARAGRAHRPARRLRGLLEGRQDVRLRRQEWRVGHALHEDDHGRRRLAEAGDPRWRRRVRRGSARQGGLRHDEARSARRHVHLRPHAQTPEAHVEARTQDRGREAPRCAVPAERSRRAPRCFPTGKTVAVHIAGPDVPGLLSKGGGGTFHFVYIAPLP